MPISLNAAFTGVAPTDFEFEQPAGAALARLLQRTIQNAGWSTGRFENWLDSGWSIPCALGQVRLEIVVAPAGGAGWSLQVAPQVVPGLLGRVFGGKPSASPDDVLRLATPTHEVLDGLAYGDFRWQWNAPPTDHSSPTPRPSA